MYKSFYALINRKAGMWYEEIESRINPNHNNNNSDTNCNNIIKANTTINIYYSYYFYSPSTIIVISNRRFSRMCEFLNSTNENFCVKIWINNKRNWRFINTHNTE